jgi:hypothetical protein
MKLNFLRQLPNGKLLKVVLVCMGTLCAVVGVVEGYMLKNWSALSNAKNNIAKLNDQIQQADRKAQQAVQDVTRREQVKSFLETQQAAMVAGDPFAWIVREISLLAEQHTTVHVLGIQPGSKEQHQMNPGYNVFTTRIEVEAGYDELGVFLQDFENKFPTAEIRSLAIAPGDRAQCRASLELAFLVRPDTDSHKSAGKSKTEKTTS